MGKGGNMKILENFSKTMEYKKLKFLAKKRQLRLKFSRKISIFFL